MMEDWEDNNIPPLLSKEQLKSKWDDEGMDENDVKESWEDEEEPAPRDKMEVTGNNQPPQQPPPAAVSSCRKKKSEQANFLEDVKDHIDEFIHASMDEHKSCFKKTINKMFGMSKIVAEREAESKGVESSLPLRTVVSD
ncbi:uncharacterized protein LOC126687906 [Mercurialis annua]|uniref:uncharacterized protein LOC126687906 n=1 Tax=Mercurialis annua TaxID=3986 RepID=UPI0024AD5415|nr:uncharacterized protein LOC126687906 [Mercurialis annua]